MSSTSTRRSWPRCAADSFPTARVRAAADCPRSIRAFRAQAACNAPCTGFELFSENITDFVDRKPPVGTDPVIGGDADGMSDYIVAISTRHPHKGIPDQPF